MNPAKNNCTGEETMIDVKKYLQEFFANKIDHVYESERHLTPNYQAIDSDITSMFQQVREGAHEHKDLLVELENRTVDFGVEVGEIFYRIGFSDGIRFLFDSFDEGGKV